MAASISFLTDQFLKKLVEAAIARTLCALGTPLLLPVGTIASAATMMSLRKNEMAFLDILLVPFFTEAKRALGRDAILVRAIY